MKNLVNWPDDTSYRDSGEGGLFAWMVVLDEDLDGRNECCVDVEAFLSRPRVMLSRPDVCVSPAAERLWEPYSYRSSWFQKSQAIRKVLERAEPPSGDLSRSLHHTLGADDISVPLRAAVFLGSTASSWCSEWDSYFQVGPDHLTNDGLSLYTLWHSMYDATPLILTFLDT